MTWFYVDDKLHSHRKAMKAGTEAMGLWVLMGSYVAAHETDGWVPDYVALRCAPNAMELAARLVGAGLWEEGQRDGDSGWWFHDWTSPWNKSHAQLQAERDRKARNQGAYRQRQRSPVTDHDHRPVTDHVTGHSPGAWPPGDRSVTTAPPLPSPPNGTPPESRGSAEGGAPADADQTGQDEGPASRTRSARRVKGHRLPDDWWPDATALEWFREKCPTLAAERSGRSHTESFRDHWHAATGRNATKQDWTAAWREWLRKEERAAAGRSQRRGSSSSAPSRPTTDDRIAAFLAGGTSTAEPQGYDVALPYDDPPAQLPAGGDTA